MKKKGLIIATIVMVLVLAVSLTTATYAWFTTTRTSTIDSISIATANGSDIAIGLAKTGTYAGATTAADFYSGQVTFNEKVVTNGDEAMGPSITTGISLAGLANAVGTGIVGTSVTNSWDQSGSNVIVVANGTGAGASNVTTSTIAAAKANKYTESSVEKDGDYIDWVIGFMPTVDKVDTITLNVTIVPSTTKPTLGLLAALHIRYSWDGTNYTDLDVYENIVSSANTNTYGTLVGSVAGQAAAVEGIATTSHGVKVATTAKTVGALTGTSDETTTTAGSANVALTIGEEDVAMTKNVTLNKLHFQLFYAGYDADCINAGLGVGANIYFTITNTYTD